MTEDIKLVEPVLPEPRRLTRAEEQLSRARERLQREKAKQKQQARRLETRRKILLGALLIQRMEDDPNARAWVKAELPKFLVNDLDRKAFGLEPRTPEPSDKVASTGEVAP